MRPPAQFKFLGCGRCRQSESRRCSLPFIPLPSPLLESQRRHGLRPAHRVVRIRPQLVAALGELRGRDLDELDVAAGDEGRKDGSALGFEELRLAALDEPEANAGLVLVGPRVPDEDDSPGGGHGGG